MSRILYTFKTLVLLSLANVLLNANDLIDYDDNYKFGLGFSFNNKSSYYDFEGTDKTRVGKLKTVTFVTEDGDSSVTLPGLQTFEFSELHTYLYSEFKLSEDWIGELNLDIADYNYSSDFTYQDSTRDADGNFVTDVFGNVASTGRLIPDEKFSRFQIQYFSPKLSYYLLNTEDKFRIQLGAQIPLSFNKRTMLDDNIFLDDGFVEINLNALYRAKFENTMLQIGAGYNFRNEKYTDLIAANMGVYFNKIENTRMYVILEYYESLNRNVLQNFILTEFPTNESYLNSRFGLDFRVEEFELKLSYTFVPWGKNYWIQNNVKGSFHYYLK